MIRLLIFIAVVQCLLVNHSFCQSGNNLFLKDYRPVSIYKSPRANISKAAFPIVDMHSHDFAATQEEVDQWVKKMDKTGIQRTVILTYNSGKAFDSIVDKYSRYPNRFEIWCGFDYTGYGTTGWQQHAIAELERCFKKGARGVGELGDKGEGELYSRPTPGYGLHIDDVQLKPLLEKCAQLKMPVSIHVAEDEWMYEKPDSTNDGMMNASEWNVDMSKANKLNHDQLIRTLENAVTQNPATTFIACHFANCCSNLQQLGNLLDKYPNLYADISARFAEIGPVPRYAAAFITKYQNRLVYGSDNKPTEQMYKVTFRILESADEHFYEVELFSYHWSLYGLNLPKNVLKKLYKTNAQKLLNH
ncbi:hypothetical protein BH10BAC3_BH10BAC3_34700 [soil metagenome]